MEQSCFDRSFKGRLELEAAEKCGCYYCQAIYEPSSINEWVDKQKTALCPKCGVDAVIPYIPEIDGTPEEFIEYLKESYNKGFGPIGDSDEI